MHRILILIAVITLSIPLNGWADSSLVDSLRELASIARYGSSQSYIPPSSKQRGLRSTVRATRIPYWSIITRAGKSHGVDPYLVQAVIKHESSFDPWAVSPKGAQGLMQLMPPTARELGVRNSFDPTQNINGGTRYLRQMIDSFGNVHTALLAYNAGPGSISRGRIPSESYLYADRVMTSYRNTSKSR